MYVPSSSREALQPTEWGGTQHSTHEWIVFSSFLPFCLRNCISACMRARMSMSIYSLDGG